jgi:hypothetical protein
MIDIVIEIYFDGLSEDKVTYNKSQIQSFSIGCDITTDNKTPYYGVCPSYGSLVINDIDFKIRDRILNGDLNIKNLLVNITVTPIIDDTILFLTVSDVQFLHFQVESASYLQDSNQFKLELEDNLIGLRSIGFEGYTVKNGTFNSGFGQDWLVNPSRYLSSIVSFFEDTLRSQWIEGTDEDPVTIYDRLTNVYLEPGGTWGEVLNKFCTVTGTILVKENGYFQLKKAI